MIAVIKQDAEGKIVGWMLGTDTHDLRRRADATMDRDLAALFYRMEFPTPGKTVLAPGVTMLVE